MANYPEPRLKSMAPQADLPPGPTWQCDACGERVRTGQPHTALEPWPHQTYAALFAKATPADVADRA